MKRKRKIKKYKTLADVRFAKVLLDAIKNFYDWWNVKSK